jgi:hypothetical protein
MLADVSDLRDCGLEPSDAALAEVSGLDRCSLCHAPQLERNASRLTTLAWLDAYAPEEAAWMRETVIRESQEPGAFEHSWQSLRTRVSIDSELWPGYAIPADLLEFVVARLDPTLAAFVPDAFLAMICGRCAAEATPVRELGARLMRVFITVHAPGNERVARMQPSWVLVERFADILDDTARVALFA